MLLGSNGVMIKRVVMNSKEVKFDLFLGKMNSERTSQLRGKAAYNSFNRDTNVTGRA